MQLLQCADTLPGGSGQWNSCTALPQHLGKMGTATPAMGAVGSASGAVHCLTIRGHWAVELVQCTATLPRANG